MTALPKENAMTLKRFLVIVLYIHGISVCSAKPLVTIPESHYYDEVCKILKEYKRPITVLEIGETSSEYTFSIASDFNAICVVLLEKRADHCAHRVKELGYKNIVVLGPRSFPLEDVETLGRCEHFDVVVVHEKDAVFADDFPAAVDLFSQLGDFVFMDVPLLKEYVVSDSQTKVVATSKYYQLVLSSKPKTSLDIARFTQAKRPYNPDSPYHIKSTFKEKWFYKESLENKVPWVPGINLITFVMLQGVYPTDTMIRRQFKDMRYGIPYHNDLVLGNVIVQGEKIVPIDLNDKRRNANMDRLLASAITVFNGDKRRFANPHSWMDAYYKSIKK
jgi:hypothetical protein